VKATDLFVPLHTSRVELLDVGLEFCKGAAPGFHPVTVCSVPSTYRHSTYRHEWWQ